MTAKTINVRLPEGLYDQIEELAKATARTKSYLTIDALTNYVQRAVSYTHLTLPTNREV